MRTLTTIPQSPTGRGPTSTEALLTANSLLDISNEA
jgi:hypothetical protein